MTDPAVRSELKKLDPQWIVLEGIDGAGTTTQAGLLCRLLEDAGCSVHRTFEPSSGKIGKLTRSALRREFVSNSGARLKPEIIALLFAADRAHHVFDEVRPALRRGQWVICDRYVHSSLAYQGNELPMEWVAEINSRVPDADATVFLDTPVDTCLSRIDTRGGQREIYEERDILLRVRERYLDAISLRPSGVRHVSGGEKSPQEVLELILDACALNPAPS